MTILINEVVQQVIVNDVNQTIEIKLTGTQGPQGTPGPTDHTLLTNKGTNTHTQIDTALTRLANTSGTNTGDQDLSGKENVGVAASLDASHVAALDPHTQYLKESDASTTYEPKNLNIQSHILNTSNPHSVTKAQVNLGNCDNTSDLSKPISTATQTALNGKENSITAGTASQYWRGDKTFQTLNKAAVGLSNVDNVSDSNKPISAATQVALDDKVTYTGANNNLDLGVNYLQASELRSSSIVNSFGQVSLDLANFTVYDGSFSPCMNYTNRQLLDTSGINVSVDWSTRQLADTGSTLSIDWESRSLIDQFGVTLLNWAGAISINDSFGVGTVQFDSRILYDSLTAASISWNDRTLRDASGAVTVLNWSTQQPSSGAQTASGSYGATEQTMIQEMYDAMRAYGLLS